MQTKQMEAETCHNVRPATRDNRDVSNQKVSIQSTLKHENISNPFCSTPHIDAMIHRGIVLAPLTIHWNYYVSEIERFCDWLETRDIVFSRFSFNADKDLADVQYGGTYIVSSKIAGGCGKPQDDNRQTSQKGTCCLTVWGIHSETGLLFMNSLFNGYVSRRSLLQNDLLQFIKELKTFIAPPEAAYFSEDILISAAVQRSSLASSVLT